MKRFKQFQKKQLAAAVLAGLCALTGNALAAQGSGSGSGGSGGGGAGTGEIFGDLYKLLRDANGVPILDQQCQQPIAAPGVSLPAIGGLPGCTPATATESCTIPVDPATCAVVVGYETYLQAVDFARMSVARAPASVMDKQLADVLVNLSTAKCLTLDPAGRLVYSNPDTDDLDDDGDTAELVSSAVDSPLQNLSIYRELIMKGSLGSPTIALPTPPKITGYSFLDTAAKSLGAASDKGGKIDIDLVVYLNQLMGLDKTTTALGENICIITKQEVQGNVQDVEKCFLNYSNYKYLRSTTYGNLPYPANIPKEDPQLGYFDYLTLYEDSTTATGDPLFFIDSASIYPTVFSGLPGFTGNNIGGFAQASDDARAVIDFMHSHPVLEGYEAPVLCQAAPPPLPVDVSSKLQMPIRMVGNTTREGTLTVVNLKGAPASGSVEIKGVDSKQTQIFNDTFSFSGLTAGQSKSFTIVFKGPSYATTISWTAVATAAGDSNETNNTATAKTTVMAPRGSGGGEGE